MSKQQGPYKKTGNLAVDMVAACIDHYKLQGRKLQFIRIHPNMWNMFCTYLLAKIPGYDLSDDTIDFDGVRIVKGTTIMVKNMYFEFEKEEAKVYLMN